VELDGEVGEGVSEVKKRFTKKLVLAILDLDKKK